MADAATILASTPGGIAAVTLENAGTAGLAGGITTFGQVFAPGQLPASGSLSVVIGGQTYAAQVDVKTTWPDGSAKMAVITMDRPPLGAGAEQVTVLVASAAPEGPAVDLLQGLASHSFVVTMTPAGHAAMQFDVLKALQDALANGTASFWQEGPLATQARVEILVPNSSQRLVFDVTAFKDGSFSVDAQFNNDRAMEAVGGLAQYSLSVTMDGRQVANETVTQYQYQNWHEHFSSDPENGGQGLGSPSTGWLNIIQDVAKLSALGVVPDYDLTLSVPQSRLDGFSTAMQASTWGDPLSNNDVTQYMPMTGGRGDIGFTTLGNATWLLSGDARAAAYALGQAEAAGAVPWNFYDSANGTWLNTDEYPRLWTDGRWGYGTVGDPNSRGLTQQVDFSGTGWSPETSHQPNLSFVPYVMTGQRWMLDNQMAQASWNVMNFWPDPRGMDQDLLVPTNQVRGAAWALREVEDALWAAPDGSIEKAYFKDVSTTNWAWLVSKIPEWTAMQGEAYGWVPGVYGTPGALPPWQQDFFASTAIMAASRGNADALTFLNWQKNFLIGRFEHDADGFNFHDGAAYLIAVSDPTTGAIYQTWAEIGQAEVARNWSNLDGWSQSQGYYGQLALASLAGIYHLTGDTRALDAYKKLAAAAPLLTTAADFARDASFAVTLPGIYGGSSGTETVSGGGNSDTAAGGSDTVGSGSGSDTVTSTGTGHDVVTLAEPVSGVTVDLGAGQDKLILANGSNAVTLRSVETVIGGAGNDSVIVAAMDGPLVADLGAGIDQLQLPDAGGKSVVVTNVERVLGGAGSDIVAFTQPVEGAIVDLGGGTDVLALTSSGPYTLSVSNTERIVSGAGDDVITLLGSLPAGTTVDLGAGKDTLILPASGSNRVLIANIETVIGGSGVDTVVQGASGTSTTVLRGVEAYIGTETAETVIFDLPTSGATAEMGLGQDTVILSSAGPNRIGISGAEAVVGGASDDTVTFIGSGTPATIDLGGGADKLILGGSGNAVTVSNVETVLGGSGDDSVSFGKPLKDAFVDLGGGKDSIVLSSTGPNVVTVRNVEVITGGTRNDIVTILAPTASASKLSGSAPDVVLDVLSIERVLGSAVNEEVHFQSRLVNGNVNLGAGTDKVVLLSDEGNSLAVKRVEEVVSGNGADLLTVQAVSAKGITIDLGGGTDKVILAAAVGTGLQAKIANVEAIVGGADDETVTLTTQASGSVIDLGGGNDRLLLGGFDNFVAVSGVETVVGNAGADRIRVSDSTGSFLNGAGGNDTLTGGIGADTLQGGAGVDRMSGGAGADRFRFAAASDSAFAAPDTILDFNPAEDRLVFQDLLQGSFGWLGTAGFTAGGHTEARYNAGSQILQLDVNGDGTADMGIELSGTNMSSITASVFLWL